MKHVTLSCQCSERIQEQYIHSVLFHKDKMAVAISLKNSRDKKEGAQQLDQLFYPWPLCSRGDGTAHTFVGF